MKEKLLTIISQLKSVSPGQKIVSFVLVFFVSVNTLVLSYDNLQNQTPIVGLKLNRQYIFGQSREKLAETVAQQLHQAGPINFVYQNQKIVVTPKEVGFRVNVTQTTENVLAAGRAGPAWQKLLVQEQALLGFVNLSTSGKINPSLLASKILEIQDKFDVDPLPERPDFAHDINTTLPAVKGTKVDVDKLTKIVGENIDFPGEKNFSLPVKITFLHRHYSEGDLNPIRTQAAKILKLETVGLLAAGEKFNLSASDLRSMLTLAERPDPKNPKNFVLVLRLESKTLNNKLGDFAARVELKNHAEFNFQYARIALYSQVFSNKPGPITISTFSVASAQPKVLGVNTTGQKIIYLTFDDGPDPLYHPLIVDILKSQGVPATFFLIGQNAQKFPDLVKKTLAAGNSINNHSLTHVFLPNLSNTSVITELSNTNNILRPLNGNFPIRLFRPPYGGTNAAIANDAATLGMTQWLWSVDPRDWSEPETSVLVDRVVSQTVPGSVILMHSNHRATVTALPQILANLKSKGYEFHLL